LLYLLYICILFGIKNQCWGEVFKKLLATVSLVQQKFYFSADTIFNSLLLFNKNHTDDFMVENLDPLSAPKAHSSSNNSSADFSLLLSS